MDLELVACQGGGGGELDGRLVLSRRAWQMRKWTTVCRNHVPDVRPGLKEV